MKYCPECGSKLPEGARFCEECGTRIGGEPVQVKSKNNKGLIIGLAALVLILLIAVVCLLMGGDDSSENSLQNDSQNGPVNVQKDPEDQGTDEQPDDKITITVDDGEEDKDTADTPVSPDVTKPVDMNRIQDVYATSSLPENDMVHNPERMLDHNPATAWIEGADGLGINESVTICFEEAGVITTLDITPGFQKSKDLYLKNSRPAKIRLTFADGSTFEQVVMDSMGEHSLYLKDPVVTDTVTLTILGVYEGTKYQDTAISDIGFR